LANAYPALTRRANTNVALRALGSLRRCAGRTRHGVAVALEAVVQSLVQHQQYIAENPVRAGLVDPPDKSPYCSRSLAKKKTSGAKAR